MTLHVEFDSKSQTQEACDLLEWLIDYPEYYEENTGMELTGRAQDSWRRIKNAIELRDELEIERRNT